MCVVYPPFEVIGRSSRTGLGSAVHPDSLDELRSLYVSMTCDGNLNGGSATTRVSRFANGAAS